MKKKIYKRNFKATNDDPQHFLYSILCHVSFFIMYACIWAHLAFGKNFQLKFIHSIQSIWFEGDEKENVERLKFMVWVCLYCRFIWFYILFLPHHTLQYMYILPLLLFCVSTSPFCFYEIFFFFLFFCDGLPSSKIGFSSFILVCTPPCVWRKRKGKEFVRKKRKKIIVKERKESITRNCHFASK